MRPFRQLARAQRQRNDLPRNLERFKFKWRFISFSASAQSPRGQVSDPDFDTDSGGWLFDRNKTEVLYLIGQVPSDWRLNSTVIPAIFWQKTTSAGGNVLWRLQYKIARLGDVTDPNFTDVDTLSVADQFPDTNTADYTMVSVFPDVKSPDLDINDILIMRLGRIGGDASDTYNADARFLYFDIYIEVDDWGSNLPLTK